MATAAVRTQLVVHAPHEHVPAPTRAGVDPFQRDPAVVGQLLPLIELVNAYFGTEVRGWSHVPTHGPFLIVGNHSGGADTHDFWFLLAKWVKERGPAAPLYGLAYDLLFSYPLIGRLLPKLGVIPAGRANARRAFRMGAPVVVFPGGEHEVFRPWSQRNRIDFGGHTGFIELAITARVPVVPMTIHGAHQSTLTLTRGRRLARLMGINRLHVGVFPLIWNIPFGPTPAFVPSLQLPSKVTLEFGRPLDWSHYSATRAHDPRVLQRCYEQITQRMQATLDALAREYPHPVLSRIGELRPSRVLPSDLFAARPPRPAHRMGHQQSSRGGVGSSPTAVLRLFEERDGAVLGEGSLTSVPGQKSGRVPGSSRSVT